MLIKMYKLFKYIETTRSAINKLFKYIETTISAINNAINAVVYLNSVV